MAGSLVKSLGGYVNENTIKFDPDKAASLSDSYKKISVSLENAAKQINGSLSETEAVWTGEAAESFVSELRELISKTQEISERISKNKNEIDSAIQILNVGNKKADEKVSELPSISWNQ